MPVVLELLSGFILTTVLGGLLGYHLQNRSWRHQQRESLRERHQAFATSIFEEISRLLDRRLYRINLLRWELERAPSNPDERTARWHAYRRLSARWYGTANRNRALVLRYFGEAACEAFENPVNRLFLQLEHVLSTCYDEKRPLERTEQVSATRIATELNEAIRMFDDVLVNQIRDGRVGAFLGNR